MGESGSSVPARPFGTGDMAIRIRGHDWAATAFGPLAAWPSRLRHAVEIMLDMPYPAAVLWGADLRMIYNDRAVPSFGASHPGALGRPLAEVFSAAARTLRDAYDTLVETGRAFEFEDLPLTVPGADGSPRTRCFTGGWTPIRDDAGTLLGILASGVDTTERSVAGAALRRGEERQAFLLALADALRPLGDCVAIQAAAARVLGEHLGADRVGYAEDQDHTGEIVVTRNYTAGVPGIEGRYRYDDYGPELLVAFRAGRTVLRPDVANDPSLTEAEKAAHAALQIGASANLPLLKNGRLEAVLFVHYAAPHVFTADEVGLLGEVAERTWAEVMRARSELALKASEARLRALFLASSEVHYRMSADWSEMRELTGGGFLRDTVEPARGWLQSYIPPQDWDVVEAARAAAIASGGVFELEHRVIRTDGSIGWTLSRAVPVADPDGTVVEWFGAATDVTQRRFAEEELRRSEEHHRTILESALDYAIFTVDQEGRVVTWPPGAAAVFGWSAEEMIGRDCALTFVPEDRSSGIPLQEMEEARTRGFAPNVRWHQRKDGRRVYIEGSMRPLKDGGPEPRGYLKIGQDVTRRRRLEERQRELLAELQHRTRNLMGVVRAMFERTARDSASLDDLRSTFADRLATLARVQGLLSRLKEGDRVTFDELIRTELAALGAIGRDGRSDRVRLEGPDGVRLRSGTIQTFALALHELAARAARDGALAAAGGRLEVRWDLVRSADGQWLRIEWTERGVPPAKDRRERPGDRYGRELIEQALPYQLDAVTSYHAGPDGVRCLIDLPIPDAASPALAGNGASRPD